jgi:hypothetical protein
VRYELRSNAVGSEQGLHRFPALEDLVQTFAAHGVEVAFVREVFHEEGEVNLASGRHARGVTVRGKTVRALAPETHIRGCLAWARAVAARPERGLHADLPQLRTTNGAALVIAQALARGQQAFVSGLDATAWLRLTTPADPACKAVPEPIAQSEALYRDYLGRAGRPTGFMAALERLLRLGLLPGATGATAREILAARDPAGLKRLSEAQIVNAALLDELVERYERLVEQFCAQLGAEAALGELPQLFDLLTQGAAPEKLHARLVEFALPERREAIEGRRGLLHELRIGLQNGDEAQREDFQRRLLADVVRLRGALDPRAYARTHRLDEVQPARLEALGPPRQWYLAWQQDGAVPAAAPDAVAKPASASAAAPAGPLPAVATHGLFELIVQLVYQARYPQPFRAGSEPPAVLLARGLLEQVRLERFDLRRLHRLHPGLPARGVAANLAAKVPVTRPELERIRAALGEALFPLERVAAPLARALAKRHEEAERGRATQAREAFLHGAFRLLAAMNYVVGRAEPDPLLRQAALAAGRALGLTMLESRDQIRRRAPLPPAAADDAPGTPEDEHLRAEGYQLLMVRDGARWFPLRAAPAVLAGTWRHLLRERVAQAVRGLVAKKLNYLVERHGAGLFALLHDHVTARPGLDLSARQFAELLVETRLFDAARLREFGYAEDAPRAGEAEDAPNPWLAALQEREGPAALEPFLGSRGEAACNAARRALAEALEGYGAPAGDDAPTLRGALAALAAEERFDLHEPAARALLARSREADALTELLGELVAPHAEAWAAAREANAALELPLPGPLAPLALLRERHALEPEAGPLQVRLLAAPRQAPPGGVPGAIVQGLAARLRADAGAPLADSLGLLQRHEAAWRRLVQAAALPLLDQMLRETVLRMVEPQGLQPADLRALPEGQVLCLGASGHDQARFGRVVARPERREAFATLSELASRLLRFGRLREELAWYRELIGDIREIIAGLNLSTYDAPYILRYGRTLGELDAALAVRPEEFAAADLAEVQRLAQSIGALVRSFYEQERSVALRDRWMSRISMRLRTMHPTVRLTFVDDLHEQARAPAPEEEAETDSAGAPGTTAGGAEAAAGARREDHQTFSERVRNVVEFRARMEGVRAFVVAPNNTQRQLAVGVIDQLYRLKGVHTAIFVDVSGSMDLLDALRTRIPAHRLFDLNAL